MSMDLDILLIEEIAKLRQAEAEALRRLDEVEQSLTMSARAKVKAAQSAFDRVCQAQAKAVTKVMLAKLSA